MTHSATEVVLPPRLAAVASAHGGVFTRGDAVDAGYSDDAIARLVRLEEWYRIRRGSYTVWRTWADCSPERQHLLCCRAVLRVVHPGTHLAAVSALVAHGAALVRPDLTRVVLVRELGTTAPLSGRHEAGCRHSEAELRPEHRTLVDGLPCTVPARSLVDHAREPGVTHDQAVIAMDSLLATGLVTPAHLAQVLEGQRSWRGSRRADQAVRASRVGSQSPGETLSRLRLDDIGLPLEALQFAVDTDRGRFWADGAWLSRRVLLEFDGRIKYGPGMRGDRSVEEVLLAERQRELALERAGWVVLRLTWADLHDLDRLRALVLGAFERAAHLVPAGS